MCSTWHAIELLFSHDRERERLILRFQSSHICRPSSALAPSVSDLLFPFSLFPSFFPINSMAKQLRRRCVVRTLAIRRDNRSICRQKRRSLKRTKQYLRARWRLLIEFNALSRHNSPVSRDLLLLSLLLEYGNRGTLALMHSNLYVIHPKQSSISKVPEFA